MQTLQLDPKVVKASRWANRHSSSFLNAEFEQLKAEIAQSGGNVQPIKVRKAAHATFEIIFGHRRHRACLELGLPLLAMVVEADDRTLWEEMQRENRARADLSPYEQGQQYRTAIDAGLYPSIRKLAIAIGVDVSQAAKVIRIADLPDEVLNAFATPNDIQVNWAPALQAALDRDRGEVLKAAKKMARSGSRRPAPKVIFQALTTPGGVEPFQMAPVEIVDAKSGKRAVIKQNKSGYSVAIEGAGVTLAALETALRRLLRG